MKAINDSGGRPQTIRYKVVGDPRSGPATGVGL